MQRKIFLHYYCKLQKELLNVKNILLKNSDDIFPLKDFIQFNCALGKSYQLLRDCVVHVGVHSLVLKKQLKEMRDIEKEAKVYSYGLSSNEFSRLNVIQKRLEKYLSEEEKWLSSLIKRNIKDSLSECEKIPRERQVNKAICKLNQNSKITTLLDNSISLKVELVFTKSFEFNKMLNEMLEKIVFPFVKKLLEKLNEKTFQIFCDLSKFEPEEQIFVMKDMEKILDKYLKSRSSKKIKEVVNLSIVLKDSICSNNDLIETTKRLMIKVKRMSDCFVADMKKKAEQALFQILKNNKAIFISGIGDVEKICVEIRHKFFYFLTELRYKGIDSLLTDLTDLTEFFSIDYSKLLGKKYRLEGKELMKKEKYVEAEKKFEKGIKFENSDCFFNIGYLYMTKYLAGKSNKDIIALFEKSVKFHSAEDSKGDCFTKRYNLILMYIRTNKTRCYKKALDNLKLIKKDFNSKNKERRSQYIELEKFVDERVAKMNEMNRQKKIKKSITIKI